MLVATGTRDEGGVAGSFVALAAFGAGCEARVGEVIGRPAFELEDVMGRPAFGAGDVIGRPPFAGGEGMGRPAFEVDGMADCLDLDASVAATAFVDLVTTGEATFGPAAA